MCNFSGYQASGRCETVSVVPGRDAGLDEQGHIHAVKRSEPGDGLALGKRDARARAFEDTGPS